MVENTGLWQIKAPEEGIQSLAVALHAVVNDIKLIITPRILGQLAQVRGSWEVEHDFTRCRRKSGVQVPHGVRLHGIEIEDLEVDVAWSCTTDKHTD